MIDVLMAVYNNADFISAQLQSLIDQSYSNFRIIIRDDSSTDDSVLLIEEFSLKHPGKIVLIRGSENLGASGNFSALMQEASAHYIMFCDADDIWLPEKIEQSLALMKENERVHGVGIPLLIHGDLFVVDKSLKLLDSSFWKYAGMHSGHAGFFNRMLVQNVVTGCTMLINRSLLELACPIPERAIMHDWWIALVASAFGKIDCVVNPLILYRQHEKNSIGARRGRGPLAIWNFARRLCSVEGRNQLRGNLLKTMKQAAIFLERYGNGLTADQKKMVLNYANFPILTGWKKRYLCLRYRYFKSTFAKTCGFFLLM